MTSNRVLLLTGTYAATIYWFVSELINPILAFYVVGLGFSAVEISIVFAAQTFLPFLFTIQIGVMADRIGHRNVLALGVGFMVIGSVMLLLVTPTFLLLLIIQTFIGLGQIAVWLSSQSIVTFVSREQRERAISRMSLFTAIGQLLGPVTGGWLYDRTSFEFVFIFYLVISLFILAVLPFVKRLKNASTDTAKGTELRSANSGFFASYIRGGQLYQSNKGVQVATTISFSLAFIIFIRVTYLPLYLQDLAYTPTQIGILIGLWSLASIIIRPFASILIEKLGRYTATYIALALSVLGLVGFTFSSITPILIITLAIIGVGTGLNQPLAISLVSQYTQDTNRGLGMGLRLMANRLANWISPVAIGTLSYLAGLGVTFSIVALPLGGISIVALRKLSLLVKEEKAAQPIFISPTEGVSTHATKS